MWEDTVGSMLGLLIVAAIIIGVVYVVYLAQVSEERKVAAMPPEERMKYLQERADYWRNREAAQKEQAAQAEYGSLNPMMICPHCHTKGTVRAKAVKQKQGISGAKATAALLTSGVSMLATGLSRKENLTQAHCDTCNSTWFF
jgi:hypothetical protein